MNHKGYANNTVNTPAAVNNGSAPTSAPKWSFSRNFESDSNDDGVRYVENYHKRKIETMNPTDILEALNNAADKGVSNDMHHMEFIKGLLMGKLLYLTSKDDRKNIFKRAAAKILGHTMAKKF